MKNLLKLFLLFFIFTANNSFASEDHGDSQKGGKKKENSLSNLSTEDLEEMKRNQLLTYLDNQNYQSQEYAVFYFEQIGEKGVPPLLKYLRSNEDDEKIVSSVIYTLGRVGRPAKKAVPSLIKYLEHPNQDIVKTTISALGKIGKASEPAIPQIAKHLEDKSEWMRTIALRSLEDIGTKQSLAIAGQYKKKLLLEQERKNRELLGKSEKTVKNPEPVR